MLVHGVQEKFIPKKLILLWGIPVCLKNITIDPDHHPCQSGFLYNCAYASGRLKVQI